jgi:hypothetical protein
MPLADIPDAEKRQYAAKAIQTVRTVNGANLVGVLAMLMIENAKLLQDCQRLRQLAGEELLPEYKVK